MQLGLSLEITIPPDAATAESLLLVGHLVAPSDSITAEDPLTVPEAVEYLFGYPAGVQYLAGMGVTWDAVRTGGAADVAPAQ